MPTQAPVKSARFRTSERDASATIPPCGAAASSPEFGHLIGKMIGPYRLVRHIGSGGMGVVWEAVEESSGRRVAVKRLLTNMVADLESHQRFVREAQLAARISHPNVTFILGAGEEDGVPYIAMELMPGTTLADRVCEKGPLEIREAVDRTLDAIDGLIAAHRIGLIHRDVKPSNCFLAADNTVKIGDFGLSKSLKHTDVNLTKTGTFMGTPSYSAPEQIRGADLDVRTDVYAVGATLFNLLTGRTPFVGDALAVTAQIISDKPEHPRTLNSKIPVDLERLILKCLEKEPAKRFQDLVALKTALIPFASHGTSLANFGRRLAAFMTDYLIIQLAMLIVVMISAVWIGIRAANEGKEAAQESLPPLMLWSTIVGWLMLVLYFGFFEGMFGRAFGKKIMGLTVVDSRGQRPGIWRALLRSFAIPGCFGLTLGFGIYQAKTMEFPADAASMFINNVVYSIGMLVVVLVCLAPMRTNNGFRGLHGFMTGTRVVWQQLVGVARLKIPTVQPTANTIQKMKFGPYESNELLGTSFQGQVYLGYDSTLHRGIWIVASGDNEAPSQARINLARPGRQRWLAGGNDAENGRWDAIQAVNGVPIQAMVGTGEATNWKQFRVLLLQLAEELRAAISDKTLPPELTLPQVWVDDSCHTILLDRRLVNLVADETEFADEEAKCPDEVRAVRLLQDTGDLLYRTKQSLLPLTAQEFLLELSKKPKSESTLDWAVKELEAMSDKLADLDWDSRAGILGASVGIEYLTYNLVSAGLFLVCFNFLTGALWLRFLIGIALSMIVPTAFGFWFRGGLVFRFMDINVCDRKGKLANRGVCAMRTILAWIPPIALTGLVVLLSIAGESQMEGDIASPDSLSATILGSDYLTLAIMFISIGVVSLTIAGLLFALKSPRRGLQDYIVGTVLLPN